MKNPLLYSIGVSLLAAQHLALAENNAKALEEITVYSEQLFTDTTRVSPSSHITAEELAILNIVNTEDALVHAPGVAIRKRFIGDTNGTLGIRGSNMFQTSRSMVFVDGMPLHNHLRTRWNGAPRWSLVAPSEIETAEVVYGPYSAEYSGNAMGGVVNIATRRPQSKRLVAEASYFNQDYSYLGFDDSLSGYRSHIAFEDSFGDLAALFSYTHLENDSQPQTFFFKPLNSAPSNASTANAQSGIIAGKNEFGDEGFYYGDTGSEAVSTDLFRSKLFYDLEHLQLRANLAYEQSERDASHSNSYLKDTTGNRLYDRRIEINGGQIDTYQFGRSQFQGRLADRESLLIGLGASWRIANDWVGDVFYSVFDVIKDEEIRTATHRDDASFRSQNESFRGRFTGFNDTGWQVFDLKLGSEALAGDERQRLSLGLHIDAYTFALEVNDYNSINGQPDADERDGDRATGRSDSGGKANTTAFFAQYGFQFAKQWDLGLGIRFEDWETEQGYLSDTDLDTRSDQSVSPKFSLAFMPSQHNELRYSAARAVRFPIVEELYVNNSGTSGAIVSDPSLKPEDGIFHSLSYSADHDNTHYRINLFYDIVDDVIFNHTSSTNVTTFLPVSEVTSKGLEIEVSAKQLGGSKLDLRFNTTYTDTTITKNANNPAFENKDFPRIPKHRFNLMAHYPIGDTVQLGAAVRYASDTHGDLDNGDTVDGDFGSFTAYTFFDTKVNWQATDALSLSLGIDNLFDEEAFVHHPYPHRTYHFNIKYALSE